LFDLFSREANLDIAIAKAKFAGDDDVIAIATRLDPVAQHHFAFAAAPFSPDAAEYRKGKGKPECVRN